MTSLKIKVHFTTASATNKIQIWLYSYKHGSYPNYNNNLGYSNGNPPNYVTYYRSMSINTFSATPLQPGGINVSSPSFSPCGWHIGVGNMTDAYLYYWTATGTVLSNTSPYYESQSFGTGPIMAGSQTINATVYTVNGCGTSPLRSTPNIPIPASQCHKQIAGNPSSPQDASAAIASLLIYTTPGTKSIFIKNMNNNVKQIFVYSSVGALLKKISAYGLNNAAVNVEDNSAEIYFVRLQMTDESFMTQKVFLQ
jgi:hypothetical protein